MRTAALLKASYAIRMASEELSPATQEDFFTLLRDSVLAKKMSFEGSPESAVASYKKNFDAVAKALASQNQLVAGATEALVAAPFEVTPAFEDFQFLLNVMKEGGLSDMDLLTTSLASVSFKRTSDVAPAVDLPVFRMTMTEMSGSFDNPAFPFVYATMRGVPGALDTTSSALEVLGVKWAPSVNGQPNTDFTMSGINYDWFACLDIGLLANMVADQLCILKVQERVSGWWSEAQKTVPPDGVTELLRNVKDEVILPKNVCYDIISWAEKIPGWIAGPSSPLTMTPIVGTDLVGV
jgi:hypothetical protein